MINTQKINTKAFFEQARKELKITQERENLLKKIACSISNKHKEKDKVNLNFICTHNSRRSQLAQVWSFFAINYFNIKNTFAFSGGTEVTAFHRNTIKCLQKAEFEFSLADFSHQNPKYLISFKNSKESILGFSKVFDNKHNKLPYIVITTCSAADKNCPFIPDALEKFHLPYEDPKNTDGTKEQTNKYLEVSKIIAGELFILFKEVQKITNQNNKHRTPPTTPSCNKKSK